jgi:hypothetical protein
MKKYIAVHTYKSTAAATWTKLGEMAPGMVLAMEQGKTPARCLTTWNPFAHGRDDMAFCLWEAEQPEDVITSLGELNDYIATDLLWVEEIAWSDIATAAKATNAAKARVPA